MQPKKKNVFFHARQRQLFHSQDALGLTPLHLACLSNDIPQVQTLLSQTNKCGILASDHAGRIPLHCAVDCQSLACVKLLLSHENEDIQRQLCSRSFSDQTPIQLALGHRRPHDEMVNLLLTKASRSTLVYYDLAALDQEVRGNIFDAIVQQNLTRVRFCLTRYPSSSTLVLEHYLHRSVVHEAVATVRSSLDILECVLEHVPPGLISTPDARGNTALHLALMIKQHHQSLVIIKLLLAKNFNLTTQVNHHEQLALHIAITKHQSLETIEALLDMYESHLFPHGNNWLNAIDAAGVSLVQYAVRCGCAQCFEVANVLLNKGAFVQIEGTLESTFDLALRQANDRRKLQWTSLILNFGGRPDASVSTLALILRLQHLELFQLIWQTSRRSWEASRIFLELLDTCEFRKSCTKPSRLLFLYHVCPTLGFSTLETLGFVTKYPETFLSHSSVWCRWFFKHHPLLFRKSKKNLESLYQYGCYLEFSNKQRWAPTLIHSVFRNQAVSRTHRSQSVIQWMTKFPIVSLECQRLLFKKALDVQDSDLIERCLVSFSIDWTLDELEFNQMYRAVRSSERVVSLARACRSIGSFRTDFILSEALKHEDVASLEVQTFLFHHCENLDRAFSICLAHRHIRKMKQPHNTDERSVDEWVNAFLRHGTATGWTRSQLEKICQSRQVCWIEQIIDDVAQDQVFQLLIQTIRTGNVDMMKTLRAQHPKENILSEVEKDTSMSLVHYAAMYGQTHMISFLCDLDHEASNWRNLRTRDGFTPLEYGYYFGHREILPLLRPTCLENDRTIDEYGQVYGLYRSFCAHDDDDDDDIHHEPVKELWTCIPFTQAHVCFNHVDVVFQFDSVFHFQILLDHGLACTPALVVPLACQRGALKCLRYYFTVFETSESVRFHRTQCPLDRLRHRPSRVGFDILRLLLSVGYSPGRVTGDGRISTLMHVAAASAYGHDLLSQLLQSSSDDMVSVVNIEGMTPLALALSFGHMPQVLTLLDAQASVEAEYEGQTAFYYLLHFTPSSVQRSFLQRLLPPPVLHCAIDECFCRGYSCMGETPSRQCDTCDHSSNVHSDFPLPPWYDDQMDTYLGQTRLCDAHVRRLVEFQYQDLLCARNVPPSLDDDSHRVSVEDQDHLVMLNHHHTGDDHCHSSTERETKKNPRATPQRSTRPSITYLPTWMKPTGTFLGSYSFSSQFVMTCVLDRWTSVRHLQFRPRRMFEQWQRHSRGCPEVLIHPDLDLDQTRLWSILVRWKAGAGVVEAFRRIQRPISSRTTDDLYLAQYQVETRAQAILQWMRNIRRRRLQTQVFDQKKKCRLARARASSFQLQAGNIPLNI